MALALVRVTPLHGLVAGDVVTVLPDGHQFSQAEIAGCIVVNLPGDYGNYIYLYQGRREFDVPQNGTLGRTIQKRQWSLIEQSPGVWTPTRKPDPRA